MACRLPLSSIERLLVVRSLPGLGDLLCSVPALRALRAALPAAEITLLGLPGTEWFRERFGHLIDRWLAFPGYPGIPEGWQGAAPIPSFLAQIQAQPFDLALQIHGNGSVINPFLILLGARLNAGFFVPGQFCPDPQRFLPYPEAEPEIWRPLRLLEHLGLPLQGEALEFPVWGSDRRAYQQLAAVHNLGPGSYICIHPGASARDRRWSVKGFARVADQLAQWGYRIVLTGTSSEQAVVQAVVDAMSSPALNLAGATDLGMLAVLLQGAELLICNDTGVSHLAAALRVPSVVVFSNSEVDRWAPLDRHRHRVSDGHPAGITATITAVLLQAQDLLGTVDPALQPQPLEVTHAL